ncbi:MAG: PEP-CTERM sorting domain-containing protein [Planctomycetaceae bacterium]|nr:PEP-CTERM sorting domain-containing protein [Planctomycetaceae bacterium]
MRHFTCVLALGAVVGLLCGAARAEVTWTTNKAFNSTFEISGTDTSWNDSGRAGLSGTANDYAGDVAKDILPGWQFAAGTASYSSMSSASRVNDTVDFGTHGQVANISFTSLSNKKDAGYISSEALSGVTVGSSRYLLDFWYRTTGSMYKLVYGFSTGTIGTYSDVTSSIWGDTGSKWVAPADVNFANSSGVGTSATWTHVNLYWDNTGTQTETFGLNSAITSAGGAGEGYTSPVVVNGIVCSAIYTNNRTIGQALRVGVSPVGSGTYSGNLYLDNLQVFMEAPPEPVLGADPVSGTLIDFGSVNVLEAGESHYVKIKNDGPAGSVLDVTQIGMYGEDRGLFYAIGDVPAHINGGEFSIYEVVFGGAYTLGLKTAQLKFTTAKGEVIYDLQVNVIPEPVTMALFLAGGLAVLLRKRRTSR